MKIQDDKKLHFSFSALILMGIYLAADNLIIAVTLTLAIGFAKEMVDHSKITNKFDWFDMLANVVGIVSAVVWILVF